MLLLLPLGAGVVVVTVAVSASSTAASWRHESKMDCIPLQENGGSGFFSSFGGSLNVYFFLLLFFAALSLRGSWGERAKFVSRHLHLFGASRQRRRRARLTSHRRSQRGAPTIIWHPVDVSGPRQSVTLSTCRGHALPLGVQIVGYRVCDVERTTFLIYAKAVKHLSYR